MAGGFFEGLVLAGRCDAGSPGDDPSVYGFRSWQEAQVVAGLFTHIDFAYTRDLLAVLRELDRCLQGMPRPRLARAIAEIEQEEREDDLWIAVRDDPLTGPFMRPSPTGGTPGSSYPQEAGREYYERG